jgi:hypothetical protein
LFIVGVRTGGGAVTFAGATTTPLTATVETR